MTTHQIKDEDIELLNRRAASSLRYYMSMFTEFLPFNLMSFDFSPFLHWLNNPWHMHSHFELQYLFHGKAEWITGTRHIALKPGQLMLIPVKQLHHRSGIVDKGQVMRLHFHIPENGDGDPKSEELRALIFEKNQVLDLSEDLRKKIEDLPKVLLSGQFYREQHAAVLLAEVLLEIFNLNFPSVLAAGDHSRDKRKSTQDFQDQVYLAALKYVNDNLTKSISVEDVAHTCGVSQRHLNRISPSTEGARWDSISSRPASPNLSIY